MAQRALDYDERLGLRRLIDRETRRRGLPRIRERVERDMRVVPLRLLPADGRRCASVVLVCRTPECPNSAVAFRGAYAGLCDDCIADLGHYQPLQ